jgi:hypothetical protein
VDAPDAQRREAGTAFARAVYGPFGKIEAVKAARIEVTGEDGRYTVSVDGGRIAQLKTEPVLGGDGKTPVGHTNTKDPLNPTVMQGKAINGQFRDGNRTFSLKGSNSFFNGQMNSRGEM